MKAAGQKIVMITAYDATFARLAEAGGADILLVGDSLGMVVQGQNNTLGVSVREMIYHTRCVAAGASRALVVADMPFLSYQVSRNEAVRHAGQMLARANAHAVKLEGGKAVVPVVRRMVHAGIPVIGHLGLTPQSVHVMGGHKVQARDQAAADKLIVDAHALVQAGIFALVLEGIPSELATQVTREVAVPTIGIGAGNGCDGQVLVMHDLLGLEDRLRPKFVKRYAELGSAAVQAFADFAQEVRDGQFPAPEHTYHVQPKA